MTLREEFETRNFSIYGQWFGLLSMIVCFATGLANILSFNLLGIIFGALALASSFIILFIEVPLLLRICPTSGKFDEAVRRISTNYLRAATYGIMGLIQFLSTIHRGASTLLVAAIFLSLTGCCYLLAAVKGQAFIGSKTLGGHGIAQMIV